MKCSERLWIFWKESEILSERILKRNKRRDMRRVIREVLCERDYMREII